jgi:hypothetical protein
MYPTKLKYHNSDDENDLVDFANHTNFPEEVDVSTFGVLTIADLASGHLDRGED